jgi:hypothetical protein
VVAFDQAYLDSVVPVTGSFVRPPRVVVPTPAGATWEDVTLSVGDHHLRIRVGTLDRRLGFADAGFGDDRTGGGSDQSWGLLMLLAKHGGTLPNDGGTKPAQVKQAVSRLRKALAALLQLDTDPFHPVTKGKPYRARFRVQLADPSAVPVPPDTCWADVTLTETPAGKLAVTVTAATRAAVHRTASDDGPGGWELATAEAEKTRTFRLSDWKLAGAAGSPNPAGAALVAVLRGRGRVRRPRTDPGMLALGKVLTQVFGLDDPPFTFDPATGTWASAFTADTTAADRER